MRRNRLVWVAATTTTVMSLLFGHIERFTPGYYDEGIYRLLAYNLIHRRFYGYAPGVSIALRAPGYPFFMAGIRSIIDSQWAVRAVQSLLAGAIVVVAASIAARLYGRVAASVTAVLLAATGVIASYSSFELSETLATFLFVAAAWMLLAGRDRGSYWLTAGAGVVLGLSILTRPQALIAVPALALWIGLSLSGAARRRLLFAVALLGAAVATVTPWSVRNSVRLHALVPVSTYGGVNFWIANNPNANGRFPGSVSMMLPADQFASIAALPEAEQDREWYRRGLAFIRAHPFSALRNWARDVAVYAGARDTYADDRGVIRGLLHIPWLDDRALWPFAIGAGVLALRRRDVRALLPGFVIGSFVAFFTVVLPLARYRHGIHPFLAIYAASFVVWLTAMLQRASAVRGIRPIVV